MTARKYKTTGNRGLFDEQDTYQKLSDIENPLEKISKVIDFEMFRKNIGIPSKTSGNLSTMSLKL